ncbi:S8 family serine peptidase [Ureibacillus aquaedulcis]|uniref:S8 family serine peptidase n=1 Tax=Ureibacillus aquaedulcis TaxID=3058421 RepID=A0ABT8GS15_9BACL|nr:S8 family serine peptidase [Ureibacillus sp. BA0131]MDN4494185.1 S8 family serine peptidase [Ureibacillus sp. BA0131]
MRLRKTLLVTIIFILSLSTALVNVSAASASGKSLQNLPTVKKEKPDVNISQSLLDRQNPEEIVRVVVELEGEPAIQKATNRGLLYKELKAAEKKSLEATIENEQKNVKSKLKSKTPSMKYLKNFTVVFNGFSAEVEAKDIEEIASTSGVKAVYEAMEYERPEYTPDMVHSKELVQAQQAWNDYGFKGEGMVVGIIDTGIDPSHKDMILSDNNTAELTQSEVNSLLAGGAIESGQFYTEKVPFGYNYMDGNDIILDLGPDASMHGMHVGGTVAANGDEENNGIKGVAPEAQLLALKVFGNDPLFSSTYGDIYIKAIDDAIKLDADVLNMSLGSPAGFVDENSPEQQAVSRATENGIMVAISSGNSDMYGSGTFYPYAENQDYGVTGSPGISDDSISVASIENSMITAYSFDYQFDGEKAGGALYLLANGADPQTVLSGQIEVMDAGLGTPEDFQGKDFTGKVALISRGSISFVEKGLNAQDAGAVAVIVYNNAAGTINMASDPAITIPFMSALQSDGLALKAALDSGQAVTVSFEGNFVEIQNPSAGQMSSFTSWGPTPNLDFKPEITAPGGNIFSTLNDDQYGLMSGTSMAAPHVAGGGALVLERVDSEFNLSGFDRIQLAKNLLMNTAIPVELADGEYVSPRRQGAGLMQLANALSTDVVVTNSSSNEGKVALNEISNDQFTFTLQAKNYSSEDIIYDVNTQLQIDYPADVGGGLYVTAPNEIGSYVLTEDEATIDAPESVTVPANGTATITISADVSAIPADIRAIYSNGFFVDGFVTLVDPNEEISDNVPLSIPFFGFNGNWGDSPIFDYFAWDSLTYWGYTALADEQGMFITGDTEGFNPDRFGFSPNEDGVRDLAIPVFSLFRNAKQFKVEVVDTEGNVLRTIRTANNLTKHYISSATVLPYTYNLDYGWDGKINNAPAADGDYILRLSGVIDYEGAEWQSIEFPVKVDTAAPTAEVTFDNETKTVSAENFLDAKNGTGVDYWQVLVNDQAISEVLPTTTSTFTIEGEITNKDKISVHVVDAALNTTAYDLQADSEEETTPPVIYIEAPGFFDVYNTHEVDVFGTIEDSSNIKSVTVNNEEAAMDGVKFSHTLNLEDGVQDIRVKAIDEFDNEMQIARKIFVDTQAPTIKVGKYPKNTKENTATVVVTLKDNFDELRLTVNGDERFMHELSEPFAMNGYEQQIELELQLADGTNEFVIEAEDLAGNMTTQTIQIKKTGKSNEKPGKGNVPVQTEPGGVEENTVGEEENSELTDAVDVSEETGAASERLQ